MAEISVIWLRIAVVFYALGLLHSILVIVHGRDRLFRFALGAVSLGAILHLISTVEEGLATRHFPANGLYESLSLCGLLIVLLFLFIYWRYKLESLSVFIFPLIFLITLVAALGAPVSPWSSPAVRNAWLTAHVVLVLTGYAALSFTAVAALIYLIQERELKRKKPRSFYYRLPPLGTLDELISRSMALAFVVITLGVVAGTIWAFVELGTGWIGEPKISVAFVTWGICLAMVCLRVSAGWRGRKAAILAITALCGSAVTWAAHATLRSALLQ